MKLFLFLALIGVGLLSSCDDTHNRFYPPKLKIKNPKTKHYSVAGEYVDSVKNVFKGLSILEAYSFELHAYDLGAGLEGIKYTFEMGKGQLSDGTTLDISKNIIPKSDTVQTIFFQPSEGAKIYKIAFSGYNRYGVQGDATRLTLVVFDNLLPEAKLTYSIDTKSGAPSLTLDASASYDRDQRFGGKVATYKFTITENGKTHQETVYKPVLELGTVDPGDYSVLLTAYDNEGAPSKSVSLDFVVPK